MHRIWTKKNPAPSKRKRQPWQWDRLQDSCGDMHSPNELSQILPFFTATCLRRDSNSTRHVLCTWSPLRHGAVLSSRNATLNKITPAPFPTEMDFTFPWLFYSLPKHNTVPPSRSIFKSGTKPSPTNRMLLTPQSWDTLCPNSYSA